MERNVYLLLNGDGAAANLNHFQKLEEQAGRAEARRLGLGLEVAFAPAFDQWRVLKRRLMEGQAKLDAVVVEPATEATMDLVTRQLRGVTGLVLLNAWGPVVEEQAAQWGSVFPFGSVSTDHQGLGTIQGRQVRAVLPSGGRVLCVTGPSQSSAAQGRLAGLRAELADEYQIHEAPAADWTEAAGSAAFHHWYRVARARDPIVPVVLGQADELAIGARLACESLVDPSHRNGLLEAAFFGVDACPEFGRLLVDQGRLTASVETLPNCVPALQHLHAFWTARRPVPLRSLTAGQPYPRSL